MNMAVLLQYILPKQDITALAGKLAHLQGGKVTTSVICWFVKRYNVNMAEAENPDIASYKSFNDFFTRPLKSGARPLAKADFICPVDGAISQFGNIEKDQIFQAKGHAYSTSALVGGDKALAKKFENGHFACLYLSPKDYHRIHMPCDGTLISMTYVPGALFSVNPTTAQGVPGLFARNERVVCEFTSAQHGSFVMVLVGATIVGSMATVWHDADKGIINPPRTRNTKVWTYADKNITLKQGDEMGRFLLGSTVVMLFEEDALQINADWQPARAIKLGEMMGVKP
ncbi:archaetidylserine decarboxylase [Methylotenera sp.]|uniref:archaetidylserine decarboxylase n=1 Tax=Methylotenera sp. TaxID=2051956 RepID=UPI00273051A4|nr:archaetidylserine decarboxylase [Methylotenera sp.]MDP2230157.1 archaetidylserine decarboxylase [Methylotenera sp.]MDP3142310.1 archaetidylserine decarboxylase [Methylotenera sp.]